MQNPFQNNLLLSVLLFCLKEVNYQVELGKLKFLSFSLLKKIINFYFVTRFTIPVSLIIIILWVPTFQKVSKLGTRSLVFENL